jgi:hypothetical protein
MTFAFAPGANALPVCPHRNEASLHYLSLHALAHGAIDGRREFPEVLHD